jgi:hypothetical protein
MKKNLTFILSLFMVLGLSLSINAQCTIIADGAGPYTDFSTPPCDATCGTPLAPAFGVWANEAYVVDVTGNSEYVFQFCTGYDATVWAALITVAEWDGTAAGTVLGFAADCSLTFTTPNSGQVMIYVSNADDCGGAYLQTDNGAPTLDCGPNGANCGDPIPCEAGTYTGPDVLNICPGFPGSVNTDGTTTAGSILINFINQGNGSGALDTLNLTVGSIPFSLDDSIGGLLPDNGITNFAGEWEVTIYTIDADTFCDSTETFLINFINDETDPICILLDVDELSAVTNWSITPNPSSGPVRVSLELNATYNEVSVEIFDITGKMVASKISNHVNAINHEFDLSNLANGMYLAKIGVDGDYTTEKIMINK